MSARGASTLALLAALSSCAGDRSIVGPATVNHCGADSECREGVCDLTRHRCVAVARTEVFFRVVPPESAGQGAGLPTLTPPRSLRTGEVVDLSFRARRTVYGVVAAQREGASMEAPDPLTAAVRFTPSDAPEVMSAVEVFSQTQPLPSMSNDRAIYTWTATLTDGTYDVLVRPAQALRATVPPRFERRFDVRSDSAQQRFDILYPASYSRWSGVIRTRAGAPVGGLSVRAVDPASHNIDVSTVVTSGGASGFVPGSFSVAMAPGAPQDWVLRITSNVNAHAGLVVEIPKADCANLDPTGHDLAIELPTELGLPVTGSTMPSGPPGDPTPQCTGCVLVNASVEGPSANGASRSLRGATVTLRTPISTAGTSLGSGARAWFEDRVQTDDDGNFSSWLVPGTYQVVIEPPDAEFANSVQSFLVGSDVRVQSGRVLTVAPRIPVEGRVITASGQALMNAHVHAVPFQDAYASHPCFSEVGMLALAPSANPDDTTTGADGTYRLDLDPGLYRIVVDPPTGAGFATTLDQTRCVQSGIRALDVVMDSPVEVHGVVRGPDGAVAPGARVEAVVRVREPGAEGVTVRVGRVIAGAGGAYSMLLPADTATSP
ncbi:MAG: carboxypeptidase-like regulatory domain-containing protein [Polyangiales bacterium]